MNAKQLSSARPRHLGAPAKANRHDSRTRNRRFALHVIASQGTTSRAEVSRLTSLTRATVSSIVGNLIEDGLVREAGLGHSAGGKPPTLIELNDRGRSIIVIDLGQRPFVGVVTDLRGAVVTRVKSPAVVDGSESIRSVISVVHRLMERAPSAVLGIGIAVPGMVDSKGSVVEAPRLGWRNVDLKEAIARAAGLPVVVANDSQAVAVAMQPSSETDDREILLINICGGVGGGLILDGRLHLGANGASGEIGHVIVDPQGPPCACGSRGCLETVASAAAIRFAITGQRQPVGQGLAWDVEAMSADYGAEKVREAISAAGRSVGEVAATLVNALGLSNVVVWSSIENSGDLWVDSISSTLVPRTMPVLRNNVTVSATQGSSLLVAGAAALVLSSELGLVI